MTGQEPVHEWMRRELRREAFLAIAVGVLAGAGVAWALVGLWALA